MLRLMHKEEYEFGRGMSSKNISWGGCGLIIGNNRGRLCWKLLRLGVFALVGCRFDMLVLMPDGVEPSARLPWSISFLGLGLFI